MKDSSCQEAYEAKKKDAKVVLLDVRSIGEYTAGHPEGALNVPFCHGSPGAWEDNPDFLSVVKAVVPRDAKVYVSCQAGGRSAKAAALMAKNGYSDVSNVRAGYGGARNFLGKVTEPGWEELKLPVEKGDPADRSYESLKKKAATR